MIYVYAINIEENSSEQEIHSLIPVLSEERKEKTWKYRRREDQHRSILGEALLKYLLWKHYGISWEEIHFQYGKFGKPSLRSIDGIYFNISHAGQWILCGLGSSPVGVDVEENVPDFMPIAERFFTREEYQYIVNCPPDDRAGIFCKLWTLKESYVKCTGKGLNIPFDSFLFCFSGRKTNMYRNHALCTDYLFESWQLDSSCYVSLCVQDQDYTLWNDRIHFVRIDELAAWRELCGPGIRQ